MDYLIIQQTGTETVVARFRRQRRTLSFVGATRQPLSDGRTLTDLLTERGNLTVEESRVILALPPADLFFRQLALPLTDRRKLREILPLELKGETALDTEELIFDALVLEDGKVLAIWGRRSVIVEGIGQLSELRLEPEIVTSSLFQWQNILPDDTSTQAVTAISDGDSMAVFSKNKPVYFRTYLSDDMGSEIAKTLAALEIGQGIVVDRLYTHGALARQEVILPSCAEPLPVSGALAEAFGGDVIAARDLAGAFSVAHACCFGEPLNFRSGSLAYTKAMDDFRKKLRLTAILAAVFVVLIFVQVGLRYYLVKKDLASLDGSVKSIYRELFPNRKNAVDEVAELKSEIKRLGAGNASGNVMLILKKLAEAKSDDITGIFETDIDGDQVRLKGDARSTQAVNDFKTKAAATFAAAEVSEIKSRPDGTVTFQFKGTFKEAGK